MKKKVKAVKKPVKKPLSVAQQLKMLDTQVQLLHEKDGCLIRIIQDVTAREMNLRIAIKKYSEFEEHRNQRITKLEEAIKALEKPKTDFDKALDYCKDVTAQALSEVKRDPITGAPIFPDEGPKKPFDPSKPVSFDNRVDFNTVFNGAIATIAPQSQIDDVIAEAVADARKKFPVREDRNAHLDGEDYTGTYKTTPAKDIPPLDIAKMMGNKPDA